ncbi:hypothetical protein [Clostridium minihomine]|uniref:hypothetical protein n=1 Tax=Clostridium minihomine TaxID=2045012 RepID=UPI0013EDB921|nr:hypothetical protein [Clostridium minihomine]
MQNPPAKQPKRGVARFTLYMLAGVGLRVLMSAASISFGAAVSYWERSWFHY